jgi:HEAT repeat protein
VAGLKQLPGARGTLTPENADAWRANFTNLVQSGVAAVPAIRAFLSQKVEKADYVFTQEIRQALGFGSARSAAIDALRQIGSPEAVDAMRTLLATTPAPQEVALLARDLEELAPGQYREQAVAVARAGLSTIQHAEESPSDVGPLFEVLQHYGDGSTVPELEKATDRWNYYATVALANLPESAGVPSILRMAAPETGGDNRVIALEMVAQLAATNPDARQFLAAQAAGQSIPANLWGYLVGPLSGDQYFPVDAVMTPYPQLQSLSDLKTTHLGFGNQNLYVLPGEEALTAEGLQQRLAVVGELLKATSDPAAVQALQRAQDTLARRSTRLLAQVSSEMPADGAQ